MRRRRCWCKQAAFSDRQEWLGQQVGSCAECSVKVAARKARKERSSASSAGRRSHSRVRLAAPFSRATKNSAASAVRHFPGQTAPSVTTTVREAPAAERRLCRCFSPTSSASRCFPSRETPKRCGSFCRAISSLGADAGRPVWRDGGEVHRRCRDGGLGDAGGDRRATPSGRCVTALDLVASVPGWIPLFFFFFCGRGLVC